MHAPDSRIFVIVQEPFNNFEKLLFRVAISIVFSWDRPSWVEG